MVSGGVSVDPFQKQQATAWTLPADAMGVKSRDGEGRGGVGEEGEGFFSNKSGRTMGPEEERAEQTDG